MQASAQKELEESWQVYAELQRMVEQSQAELVEVIATRQRDAERHAQELARGLENELSQLRRRSNELEAFAQTQDKVVFLQVGRVGFFSVQMVYLAAISKNWSPGDLNYGA